MKHPGNQHEPTNQQSKKQPTNIRPSTRVFVLGATQLALHCLLARAAASPKENGPAGRLADQPTDQPSPHQPNLLLPPTNKPEQRIAKLIEQANQPTDHLNSQVADQPTNTVTKQAIIQ